MIRIPFTAVLLLLLTSAWAIHAQPPLGKPTLKGLLGGEVIIEQIKSNEPNLGLTQDEIRTEVELRLRKAGVRVLTAQERLRTPGVPFIVITVTTALYQ